MISDLNIPKEIFNLNEIFKKNSKKLYLVGGAVRDFVTCEMPKDFDLATDATPKEMIDMFIKEFGLKEKHIDKDGNDKEFDLNNGIKLNLQGAQFGVLVVYNLDGLSEGVEIATFREDLTKGRNPKVKIGATIEEDIKRRDLVINSMFFDLENKNIIDLLGGRDDLCNKIIRMVGNPVDRIEEDKLRILRAMRFSTRYDSVLDNETTKAIKDNNELNGVSPERIWEEFNKSFKQAKKFKNYLDLITEFDMWNEVFHGLNITLDNYKETDNIVFCFAQIFRDNDSNIVKSKMVKQFQSPSDIANEVAFLMDLRDFDIENVKTLVKTRERFHMSHETISEWFEIANLNEPKHKAFVGFEPDINSRQIMSILGIETDSKGNPKNKIDGQRVGEEINKRIVEQFQLKLSK